MWPVIAVLVLIVTAVALAVAICWLWDRVTSGPDKPWSQEGYDRRLVNPDFAALERHFGCPIPQAIRDLYADSELILKKDCLIRARNDEFEIAHFTPADVEGAESWWPAEDRKFILADTGGGDSYYVELSLTQPNPLPVYVLFHDGGDTCKVADSLEEFIELCREARPLD